MGYLIILWHSLGLPYYYFYKRENGVATFSRLFLIRSFFILACNEDMHESSEEFEVWPDPTTDYGVSCL